MGLLEVDEKGETKVRLLFTVNTYVPKRDGVQFVTKYLAEGLVKKGHSVDLITRRCEELTKVEDEVINGVHVLRWKADTKHTFHKGDKKGYQKYLIENAEKYDCMINVGTQTSFVDWMLPIMDQVKCPKILYLHSIWDFKYHKNDFDNIQNFCKKTWANIRWKIYYSTKGRSFKKFAKVIQLHKFDYSNMFFKQKYGIDSVIIENAAEKYFFDDTTDNNIEVPEKYFINVSNYMDRKNQLEALKCFLEADISNEFELILIGSSKNQYYDELIKYYNDYCIKNKNYKKVHFLYNISREKIYTYVKKSYSYVMTSKWEAYPISLIESMAASVPWISTDVGIVRYLPGGVVAKNHKEIVYWIEFIANNKKIAKEFGKIGNEYAIKQFEINKKVDLLEKYIIDVLEEEK